MYDQDFVLTDGAYFLNHSVGRPLKSMSKEFSNTFWAPWQESGKEPWGQWLTIIDSFREGLAQFFNSNAVEFCPQTNLSSALTKLVMSLPRLQSNAPKMLMSEIDFPSMGFVLQKALPSSAELRFIPKTADITDANVWQEYMSDDLDMVFISHAYSNTGQKAPIEQILPLAKDRNILSIVDVAQSAGIIPVDVGQLKPDFLIGSSVKWFCGGPGAAYLWVNPDRVDACKPKDVGWFSHESPFEFDIRDFRYHSTALKFWGGTPSIAPYAMAAHSIHYFSKIGAKTLRQHNQCLIDQLATVLAEFFVSPIDEAKRSGTAVLNFGAKQEKIMDALTLANISVDQRIAGIRVSPHIYNNEEDVFFLIDTVKNLY